MAHRAHHRPGRQIGDHHDLAVEQLLGSVGGVDEIGPVLLGIRRPVTVVPPACSVETIVQMTAIAALQAVTRASQWPDALTA